MAAWEYYGKEQVQHKALYNTAVKCSELQPLAEKVIAAFGYPGTIMVTVKGSRAGCNVWSHFKPGHGLLNIRGRPTVRKDKVKFDRIEISNKALDLGTLAHELAHCLHYREYQKTHKATHPFKLPHESSHGLEHKSWMNKVCEFFKKEGLVRARCEDAMVIVDSPAPKAAANAPVKFDMPRSADPLPTPAEIASAAWWAALPEQQLCSKCGHTQHKDEFGMRTVSEGKYARQGYCRTCRKDYYKAKKLAKS